MSLFRHPGLTQTHICNGPARVNWIGRQRVISKQSLVTVSSWLIPNQTFGATEKIMVVEKCCSHSAGCHIIQGGRCGQLFSRKVEKIYNLADSWCIPCSLSCRNYVLLGAITRLQPHHSFLPEVNFGAVQADQHSSLCNKIEFSTTDYTLNTSAQKAKIMKQKDSI